MMVDNLQSIMVDMNTLGSRLRADRQAAGMTIQQLADAAGVTKQAISAIERNETKNPEAETLERVGRRLGLSTRWLLDGTGPKARNDSPNEDPKSEWADILASTQHVSAGDGAEAHEYQETHKLKFRAESLRRKGLRANALVVYYAKGDSMEPRIRKGDAILFDTTDTKPADGAIYVIQWRNELYAKRANIIEGVVYFESDNPAGDHSWRKPKRMADERQPIIVFGRVRWIGSWED